MPKPSSQPASSASTPAPGTSPASTILLGVGLLAFVVALVLLGVLSRFDIGFTQAFDIFLFALVFALILAPAVYWLVVLPAERDGTENGSPGALSALTVTDLLTQLMNRRGITMSILEAMAQAERYNTPLAVAMVDVDGFQRVNDEFGNAAGDKVLAELAGIMADTLRMPDKLGRFDGEEFLAVLPHTGLVPAKKIAERLRATAAGAKLGANGKRVALTVSIGVTQYAKGEDLENLLSRTQSAVRDAKKDSGNRVVVRKSAR